MRASQHRGHGPVHPTQPHCNCSHPEVRAGAWWGLAFTRRPRSRPVTLLLHVTEALGKPLLLSEIIFKNNLLNLYYSSLLAFLSKESGRKQHTSPCLGVLSHKDTARCFGKTLFRGYFKCILKRTEPCWKGTPGQALLPLSNRQSVNTAVPAALAL